MGIGVAGDKPSRAARHPVIYLVSVLEKKVRNRCNTVRNSENYCILERREAIDRNCPHIDPLEQKKQSELLHGPV